MNISQIYNKYNFYICISIIYSNSWYDLRFDNYGYTTQALAKKLGGYLWGFEGGNEEKGLLNFMGLRGFRSSLERQKERSEV